MRALPRSSSSIRALFPLLFALLPMLVPPPAQAGWQSGGVRLPAVTPGDESLRMNGIVSDGAQGAIVSWVWNHYTPPDHSDYRIMSQRVDVQGNIPPPWPSDGLTARSWYSDP